MPKTGHSLSIDITGHEVTGVSPRLCRDPAEVVKGLYIGSLDVARCPARLACLGVQAVVDASQTAYHLPPGIERLIVDEEDQPCADLHRHFGAVSQFVASHVRAGRAVLVHCRGGISRSATLAIAYLLHSGTFATLRDAYSEVKAQKPNICPNEGFFRQLLAYERQLRGASTMTILDYYRDAFVGFGYPRREVDRVLASAGTDDYQALVATLHAREPEVAGAASRESSGSRTPLAPLLDLLSPHGRQRAESAAS